MLSRMLSNSCGRNDPADRVFDEIGKPRGFFNARTGLGAQMENELPAVSVGEKVLTQPWREGPGGKTEQEKHRDET